MAYHVHLILEPTKKELKLMIVQFIRLHSKLSEEELLIRARERKPRFQAIPGLIQKYYVKLDEPGKYGGIYIWDSQESLNAYRESELAQSIPEAYQVIEAPAVELMDLLFQLRD
jgi:heme-degrading monooxygenase HmoA